MRDAQAKGAGGTSHNVEESQQYWHDPVQRDAAMKIPTKKAKKGAAKSDLPDTTDILDAFNSHLQNQTRFHAGYPCVTHSAGFPALPTCARAAQVDTAGQQRSGGCRHTRLGPAP